MNTPEWLATDEGLRAAGWRHGWTTTAGPDFRAEAGEPAMAAAMAALRRGAGLAATAWVRQVHGGAVLRATGPGLAGDADALWTTEPGLAVVGRGADCPLVLVAGRLEGGGGAWGFAHASWRSTVAGITPTLLNAMTEGGLVPGTARAVVCPSAGPCCYEVGPEVRAAALSALGPNAARWFTLREDRWLLDLWGVNDAALRAAGVPAGAITHVGHCTICGGDRFPSHRRQGAAAGRFAAFVAGPSGQDGPDGSPNG